MRQNYFYCIQLTNVAYLRGKCDLFTNFGYFTGKQANIILYSFITRLSLHIITV